MFQTKVVEEIKTHILYSVPFFLIKSCRLSDNVEKYCRVRQATVENMAHEHACWIPKAINTHSQYLITIAFPLQRLLLERASLLRCA